MATWNPTAPTTWTQYIARWAFVITVMILVIALASVLVRPETWDAVREFFRVIWMIAKGIHRAFQDPYGA